MVSSNSGNDNNNNNAFEFELQELQHGNSTVGGESFSGEQHEEEEKEGEEREAYGPVEVEAENILITDGHVVGDAGVLEGCFCYFDEYMSSPIFLIIIFIFGGVVVSYVVAWLMGDDENNYHGEFSSSSEEEESEALIFLREKILSKVVVSDSDLLWDVETPQYQAMKWLAEEVDEQQIILHQQQDNDDDSDIEGYYDMNTIIQRYIMSLFYYSMNGDQWLDKGSFLNHTKHICEWGSLPPQEFTVPRSYTHGNVIICDDSAPTTTSSSSSSRDVQVMVFWSNNLVGSMPEELALLNSSLTTLILDGNRVHGTIPSYLGYMSKLKVLRLKSNDLTGNLPYFHSIRSSSSRGNNDSTWSCLEELDVQLNNLNGTIHHIGLENMVSLTKLDLSRNLFSGTIPQQKIISLLEAQQTHQEEEQENEKSSKKLQNLEIEYNNFRGNMTLICNNEFVVPRILVADCKKKIVCDCCIRCH